LSSPLIAGEKLVRKGSPTHGEQCQN